MSFRKFLKDIDMSDETTMFEGFKDGCCVAENCGIESELCVGVDEEKELIRKRKRECYLPLLDWVKRVAKDPCDLAIGSVPGSSKWKAYGSEYVWKQALLAKEAMVLKVNDDSNDDQSVWKKKRKMHPDMYSDQPKTINSRCCQRLVSIKETRSTLLAKKLHVQDYSDSSSTESQSDVENEEIPEWTPETYKCETKWLGTRVWPLEDTVKRGSQIERETLGKGRQSSNENQAECCSMHLIDADGNFNADELDNFVKHAKLEQCGVSYAVVAIMGPHSTGKSTLLNHLFYTNFKEMDAESGRSPTTHGIWMARSVGTEPCTVVMDLQGSNRGEDDTAFEQQSALFALAVSDIVLINMWCHDIGCGQAAHKLLLKTVFETMFKFFATPPRARTLFFVLRDKTKTSLEKLEPDLIEEIQKIWDSVSKPETYKLMTDIFNVQVVALSSYEEKEEQFNSEVASLRQKISFAPDGLAGDRQEAVPASVFSSTAQQFWKSIKKKKPATPQPLKLMTSVKKIVGLGLANEKVELMKDSPFKSLASVTHMRESSALHVQSFCKVYDTSERLCYLSKDTPFSFCSKEVARVLGMEDSGLNYNEYEKECGKYPKSFPAFIADLQTQVPNVSSSLQIADIATILKGMSVAGEEKKTQFKQLMTYYLIETFLKCSRNPNKARRETWRLVVNLKKCWSVNWPQATAEHLHDAMKSCREWWDKGRPNQHYFTGCAPVLEAVSFDRIAKIRPKILNHHQPIEKYEAKRVDLRDLEDSLLSLITEDIDMCPDCGSVTMTKMKGLSLSESDEGDSAANTLEKENEAELRNPHVEAAMEVAVAVEVVATGVGPRRGQREKKRSKSRLETKATRGGGRGGRRGRGASSSSTQ